MGDKDGPHPLRGIWVTDDMVAKGLCFTLKAGFTFKDPSIFKLGKYVAYFSLWLFLSLCHLPSATPIHCQVTRAYSPLSKLSSLEKSVSYWLGQGFKELKERQPSLTSYGKSG